MARGSHVHGFSFLWLSLWDWLSEQKTDGQPREMKLAERSSEDIDQGCVGLGWGECRWQCSGVCAIKEVKGEVTLVWVWL